MNERFMLIFFTYSLISSQVFKILGAVGCTLMPFLPYSFLLFRTILQFTPSILFCFPVWAPNKPSGMFNRNTLRDLTPTAKYQYLRPAKFMVPILHSVPSSLKIYVVVIFWHTVFTKYRKNINTFFSFTRKIAVL